MKPWNGLFNLTGGTAVVTGGALGIGAGIATRLAEQGASVVIADVDAKAGRETLDRMTREGYGHPTFIQTDVRDLESLKRLVDEVVKAHGRLDILVNNAGIFPMAPALAVTPESWNRVLEVNLRAPFFLSQAAARQMRAQGGGGTILNIASVDALHPTGFLAPYDASKGGLRMLTRALALEFAPFGIRVNAIAPGAIQTPGAAQATASLRGDTPAAGDPQRVFEQFLARIPARRMGEPDDIARAVVFLVSPAADYITGVTLVVDGGYLLT